MQDLSNLDLESDWVLFGEIEMEQKLFGGIIIPSDSFASNCSSTGMKRKLDCIVQHTEEDVDFLLFGEDAAVSRKRGRKLLHLKYPDLVSTV